MSLARQVMLGAVSALVIVSICVDSASAQGRRPSGGGGGFRGGNTGGSNSLLELTRRDEVREELELLDDQIEQLDTLRDAQRNGLRDLFGQVRDLPQEGRTEKIRALMQQAREQVDSKVDQILLPHQSGRLKQLSFQLRIRGGSVRAFTNEQVAGDLGLSTSQQEKLKAKAEQVEKDLQQKINSLRQEAQNEMLNLLTPQQRAQWKDLAGEAFEFKEQPRREGGDRQRGAGGNDNRPNRPQRPDNN